MKNLKVISKRLLKRNPILTTSCLLSVLVGTMLIIEMFNLALCATKAYEKDMKALYGDCDVAVFYSDYSAIEEKTVEEISRISDVTEVATLWYASDIWLGDAPVYSIGTDNSSIVRSRYHFQSILGDNQVAINQIIADVYEYEVGSLIMVGEKVLEVVEIFDDKTLAESSIEMLVVNKKTLKAMNPIVGNTNIMMLKVDELENSHIDTMISLVDDNLDVLIFGIDEAYLKSVNAFKLFITIVAVCVIVVTSLFTATVFKSFIYKYRRDMAVLRMTGATSKQINVIFSHMMQVIALLGVVLGFLLSFVANKLFLTQLNEQLHLIDGEIEYLFAESFVIGIFIYIIIRLVLQWTIRQANIILPIEALSVNEMGTSGKMKRSHKRSFQVLRGDFYISVKLIKSRLRENLLMIATVAMLVAISILGASLSNIIKANGEKYYKEKYLAEVVLTSSNSLTFQEGEELYRILKDDSKLKVSCVHEAAYYYAEVERNTLIYGLTDINAFAKQGIIEPMQYSEDAIILSQSYAEQFQYEVGDYIQVWSPRVYAHDKNGIPLSQIVKEEKEYTFQVASIMPDFLFGGGNDAYIDTKQVDFVHDGVFLRQIYIDGDKEYIEQKLKSIKRIYPTIKWANYTDAITENSKGVDSRFQILEMVVKILVFIASIGWMNSLRNIFISRIKDYDIIRMQGVSQRRIVKIMIYQIIVYLLIGVTLGVMIGATGLEILMYWEQKRFTYQFNLEIMMQMIGIMLLFCVMLIPTMKKISSKRILEE